MLKSQAYGIRPGSSPSLLLFFVICLKPPVPVKLHASLNLQTSVQYLIRLVLPDCFSDSLYRGCTALAWEAQCTCTIIDLHHFSLRFDIGGTIRPLIDTSWEPDIEWCLNITHFVLFTMIRYTYNTIYHIFIHIYNIRYTIIIYLFTSQYGLALYKEEHIINHIFINDRIELFKSLPQIYFMH